MAETEAGSARKPLRTLHRWLGLWIGTWFALVGLSGAILVYEDEVDAWLNPRLLTEHRPVPTCLRARSQSALRRSFRSRTSSGCALRARPATYIGWWCGWGRTWSWNRPAWRRCSAP
jgi:hypothetical protein